jgi:hypothetical protein
VQRKDSAKRSLHIRNFEWGCEFVLSFNNDLYFKGHKEEKENPAVNNQPLMNQMKQKNINHLKINKMDHVLLSLSHLYSFFVGRRLK